MYKESLFVELKRELIDEIKNEIVAFLNTKGGTIIVGVNDDGTINEEFKRKKDGVKIKIQGDYIKRVYMMCSNLS